MATLEQNKDHWDDGYDWQQGGDEWSASWGNPRMQWYGALLPRIRRFVPTGHILEIAPGFGRWTQFLADLSDRLTVVDLADKCIAACRERFSDRDHIEYHVNDGVSLDMVADNSVDFVFSFDSLVHADPKVIEGYIRQLARILRPEGVACLHHSNLHEYMRTSRSGELVPNRVLKKERNGTHWRDPGMSAELVRQFASANDLVCVAQELVNWGTKNALIDCFSTIARDGSQWECAPEVLRNPDFMREAAYWGRLSACYG